MLAFAPYRGTIAWPNVRLVGSGTDQFSLLGDGSQCGGVTQLSVWKTAHRVESFGVDPSGLGRWAWTCYRGRDGVNLRVATGYRPCKHTRYQGSVYRQQQRFFYDHTDDRCPRAAFFQDLGEEVKKWTAAGGQLVLMMHANGEVREPEIARLMTEGSGLHEICLDKHGTKAPDTHISGAVPIDGIFVSSTLWVTRCGFLALGEWVLLGDHRRLWLEIPYTIAFGHTVPDIITARTRVRNRYIKLYRDFLIQHRLPQRAFEL
jgi:hypothetical protein